MELAALVVRAAAHRIRHGKPTSLLGRAHLGAALSAMFGANVWRCPCGAMAMASPDTGGIWVVGDGTPSARTCPTFELRDRLRRSNLPRAVLRR